MLKDKQITKVLVRLGCGVWSVPLLFASSLVRFFSGRGPGPGVIKHFMFNSAEHEIYPAHKYSNAKMPTIVGILTFISMINILCTINLAIVLYG